MLIDRGADPNLVDKKGNTALHYATVKGELLFMNYLKEIVSKKGLLSTGQDRIIQKLIEKGADINFTDDEGNTALHSAVNASEYQLNQLIGQNALIFLRFFRQRQNCSLSPRKWCRRQCKKFSRIFTFTYCGTVG